jgi:hypothetical protein
MNRHLSSQDVCAWLAGSHTPELQQHVTGCAVCQAELARWAGRLRSFASGAVGVSSNKPVM